MGKPRIDIPGDKVADFCRRHRIRRLSLFGSVLRADFRPGSDVDVLVEFEPEARVGLRFFAMERELSEILKRKVDLNTPGFLSDEILQDALREAEVQLGQDTTVDDMCRSLGHRAAVVPKVQGVGRAQARPGQASEG